MSIERFDPADCIMCEGTQHKLIQTFLAPPIGENTFGITDYYRELWNCKICGLFTNWHNIELEKIYKGAYRNASYGGEQIRERYEKVMALPPENSDNRARVSRIIRFMSEHRPSSEHKALDIGSGMAVFPAAMCEAGWGVVAVDPDAGNVAHARETANVIAIQGAFPEVEIEEQFPLITFNKVLEHIKPIQECLSAAHELLTDMGIVYIELPDGEAAIDEGPMRQEFFLEHYYTFSATSITLLANRAGFRVLSLERLRDPSGKYTLAAFLSER